MVAGVRAWDVLKGIINNGRQVHKAKVLSRICGKVRKKCVTAMLAFYLLRIKTIFVNGVVADSNKQYTDNFARLYDYRK